MTFETRGRTRVLTLPYEFHLPEEGDDFWDRLKAKAKEIDAENAGEYRSVYTDEQAFCIVFEDGIDSLRGCLDGDGWGYCCADQTVWESDGWELIPADDVEPPPPTYMPRSELAAGTRFRVAVAGLSLQGMVSEGGGAWSMGNRPLEVGEVIECLGYGPGWGGDPGYGTHWKDDRLTCAYLMPTRFNPFNYGQPQVGWLEPVTDTEEAPDGR